MQDYVALEDLRVGTALRTYGGSEATVLGLTWKPGEVEVFNLEVEGVHNYFVLGAVSDEAGVLVHNGCGMEVPHGSSPGAPAREVEPTPGKGHQAGGDLSMEDAVDCVKCGGDVIAKGKSTAREIADRAGDGPPVRDPAHKPGEKPHYHPTSDGVERTGRHVLCDDQATMNIAAKIQSTIEATGAEVEPLAARDRWRLLGRWRSTFASEVENRTGQSTHLGYEWHAFSYGFSPAREGSGVLADAMNRLGGSYLVLSGWTAADFGFRCRGPLPDFGALRLDTIVVGPEMNWTLVFTHEPGIGPFFATT